MKVGIIGSGTMGSGIAQIASTNKHDVVLYDSSSNSLKNSKEKFVKTVVRKKRISKVEKKYINREEYRILNTEAYNKFFNGKKELITENDIKFLFKVDDYSTKEDVEKRT